MSIENVASLAAVGATMVAAVNVIMEVLKSFWLKEEIHRPPVVVLVSVLLSYAVAYAFCVINECKFTPLLAIGAFVGGFLVAYGAMFGYDNLYGEIFKRIEELIGGKKGD